MKAAGWILIGVLALLIIGSWLLNSRRYKKQQQERDEKMKALAVGDKILTIGMLVGEIAEICEDGNYVLKTGSDANVGYITVQPNAIYQIFSKEEPVFENNESGEEPFAETADKAEEEKTEEDVLTETVGNIDEKESEEVKNG